MDITSDEYLKLKKKYEIPIKTHRLDLTKTYCKLLLLNNPNFKGKIKPEFDNNYQTTGNIILELTNDKKIVVSDDKLIEIIRLFIKNTICEEYFDLILYYYNNFKDFKIFININFPELNFESKNNFKNIL